MGSIQNSEFEVIRYEKLRHLHLFLVNILYRNAHEHSDFELDLILRGKARVRCRQEELEAGPGELLLFSAYEPHELASETTEPIQILSVQISNHFCKEYFPWLHNVEFSAVSLTGVVSAEVQKEMRNSMLKMAMDFFREDATFPYRCVGECSLLLASMLEHIPYQTIEDQEYTMRKRKTARIRRITSYIDQHYKERIMLPDLAETEGITTTYLSHFFHDTFHMTFQEYLNRLRLEKALILMKDPNLYLVDICLECGFSDNKYLNRIFMKKFGCSAQEYRKRVEPESTPDAAPASYSEYIYAPADSLALLEQYQ